MRTSLKTTLSRACLLSFSMFLTGCPEWWQVKTVTPDNPPISTPTGQRFAMLFSDNNDFWFNAEAMALATSLRSRGWTVFLTGETADQPDSMTALSQTVDGLVSGDHLLVDIQTHGGDVYEDFNTNMSAPDYGVQRISFGFGARFHGLNPGMSYPTSRNALGEHALGVYNARADRGEWLSPNRLLPLLRVANDRGVNVTVIDHSCGGGASVALYELELPRVCTISTTGAVGPGLTGWPAVSQVVAEAANMESVGRWISTRIYEDQHPNGSRLHQVGNRTGCAQTMPVRDLLDAAAYGYGTWWHWMRQSASHPVREPARYADFNEVADYVSPHHPEEEMAEGWAVWLEDNASRLTNSGYLLDRERRDLSTKIANVASAVRNYGRQNAELVRVLQASTVTAYDRGVGFSLPLDRVIYANLVGQCACEAAAATPAGEGFVATHDCRKLRAMGADNDLVNRDASLRPDASICANPRAHADRLLALYPDVAAAYSALQAAQRATVDAAKAASASLQLIEMRCVSNACASKPL